jgi:hypothetical protein
MTKNIVQPPYQKWQPVAPLVLKDRSLQEAVHKKGFAIRNLLSEQQISNLRNIYSKYHSFKTERGGMFYSLYSSDIKYRLAVHNEIQEVLQPTLDKHLQHYKVVINSFVVKASGPKSEFYLHQDTTALDEERYTSISWWIPLQDISAENGALCVVEKTHWFFSRFRGASFPFAFHKIKDTIRSYLKPLRMKRGEVLIFDPRIVHNSLPNLSGKDRIVIVCGIFPENAEFITCWKDSNNHDSHIEFYKHSDDYTLKYPNFLHNCHDRPVSGTKIGESAHDFPDMTSFEFEELCRLNQIERADQIPVDDQSSTCEMIAEPDQQATSAGNENDQVQIDEPFVARILGGVRRFLRKKEHV